MVEDSRFADGHKVHSTLQGLAGFPGTVYFAGSGESYGPAVEIGEVGEEGLIGKTTGLEDVPERKVQKVNSATIN